MSDGLDAAFRRNTRRRRIQGGWSVYCRKGLWSVRALTEEEALREARHYFAQYHADGEYDTARAAHQGGDSER